jgi:hypothetical protein
LRGVIQWGYSARVSETMLYQWAKIHPEQRSKMTKEKSHCEKQGRLAHFDLEKSVGWDRSRKCS